MRLACIRHAPLEGSAVDGWGRRGGDARARGVREATGGTAIGTGRSRRVRALLAAAILGVLVLGTTECVEVRFGPSDARPLTLSFPLGRTGSYRFTVMMDGSVGRPTTGFSALTIELHEVVSWTVIHVDPDGAATARLLITDVSATVNGTDLPEDRPFPTLTMRIAPDGRVLTAQGLSAPGQGDSGLGFPGMGQFTPVLPGTAVSPGDRWGRSFTQAFAFGSGRIEYDARSTLLRYQQLTEERAAVVRTRLYVPLSFTLPFRELSRTFAGSVEGAALPRNASIVYGGEGAIIQDAWLDPDAGRFLRSSSSGSFDVTMSLAGVPDQAAGPIHFTGRFTQSVDAI